MMAGGEVPQGLKFMVGAVTSTAAGDNYCAAHNAENASHIAGVPVEKIRALADFRNDAQFTPAERAALELGAAAGAHPPRVTDAHFEELKKYFSDDAMVEIVAVISLLGWLNRWAQTVAPQTRAERAGVCAARISRRRGGRSPDFVGRNKRSALRRMRYLIRWRRKPPSGAMPVGYCALRVSTKSTRHPAAASAR